MQMIMEETHRHGRGAQKSHKHTQYTVFISARVHHGLHTNTHTPRRYRSGVRALDMQAETPQDTGVHLLLFVAGFPGLTAAVLPVGGWDGVDGGALFAGGMGGVGRVGQACSGLARVVVELHEAEDQVCGHQLELVRWIRDHISAQKQMVEMIKPREWVNVSFSNHQQYEKM